MYKRQSWYRDKSACRDVLDKLGLPAPGFRKISVELLKQGSEEEIQQSIANLQYPLISKPLDKYGSRGIFIIHHSDEVRKKALQTAEYTDCQEILVEEYNDGYEFNMMTWVMDGKVNVISIADREKTEMEEGMLPLSTRNVYPSRFLAEVEKSATDILQNYIRYTGQTEGALSMQFFWKPGRGIQVCEIAGRFFGYEHELTDMVYGFQTEELLLDYLYEKDRIKEMFDRHDIYHPVKYGAVLYFQGRQLQIADQTAACELAKEKCVVTYPFLVISTVPSGVIFIRLLHGLSSPSIISEYLIYSFSPERLYLPVLTVSITSSSSLPSESAS